MLKIRDEQVKAFEGAAVRNFEDQMVEHLKEFTPKHCEILGERCVRQVIQLGMERAKKYGFRNRGPVRFYIELIFMLGSDFDTDPQLPWAAEVLSDTTISDQTIKADRLYDRAMDYLHRVAGPNHEYSIEAIRRISRARVEDFQGEGEDFESKVIRGLKMMYPQKCEYLGEPGLRAAIQRGTGLAESYSVSSETGVILFIALVFALGHCFASDPQFPWISAALNDPLVKDPNGRAERLHAKMMAYVRRALGYLEQSRDHV